jgi:hypothetical protein
MTITIKKTQDRDNVNGFGACWELSNGDWIQCELDGEKNMYGEGYTLLVSGYELNFADIDTGTTFFSVKMYGTARRAFEAAKRFSITRPGKS